MKRALNPPRRLPKSESTIASILEAAARLFVFRSYADVSMNHIAQEARLTKGALYHHFPGKEQVYVEMLHLELTRQETLFTRALGAGVTCRVSLSNLVACFLSLSPEEQGVMQLLRRDLNMFDNPTRADLIRAYQNTLPIPVEQVLYAGMQSGELRHTDPRLLSWHFVALVEAMLSNYAGSVFNSVDERTDHVIDLFLRGASLPHGDSS